MKSNTAPLILFLGFLFGFLPFAVPASEPASPKANSLEDYLTRLGYTGVPFKRNEQDIPLVQVEMAGRKRVLLVDSGCTMTAIEPETAFGLKTLGELGVILDDSFLGTITNGDIALMSDLRLGPARLLNQPALVEKLDMDFVRVPHQGILGLDFLFRNFCLIDCHERKIYLRASRPSGQLSSALEESLRQSGFTGVPLSGHDFIAIQARINDHAVKLVVDTGDGASVLDQGLAERLHLKPVKELQPDVGSLIPQDATGNLIGINKIGMHRAWVALLASFEVGERRWRNMSYGVIDLKAWKLIDEKDPEHGPQGLFGQELLAAKGGLIDFANRKLWFRPEKHAG